MSEYRKKVLEINDIDNIDDLIKSLRAVRDFKDNSGLTKKVSVTLFENPDTGREYDFDIELELHYKERRY